MTIATAKTKYVRLSPRKARTFLGVIRGKPVMEALVQLNHSNLKAADALKKTLNSAIANAENNYDARREHLFISEVRIDEGPTFKRAWARNKGRRALIRRKMSHIFIALDQEANEGKEK